MSGGRASRPKASRIDLHIDELVLEGIDPRDRQKIATALERELARLLRERSIPALLQSSREIESIDAGAVELSARMGAEGLGAQAGRAVYRGMVRERR